MKKQLLFALLTVAATNLFSADLIVDITGVGGAYTSIGAAIGASSPGDRILVYPNASPFSENPNINHSLEITTAVEGEYFRMAGSFTINPWNNIPANSEITISGAQMLSGNITTPYNATNCKVNIVGCKLNSGYVSFNTDGYVMNIAKDSLMNGYVSLRFGKIVGCFIDATYTNSRAVYIGPSAPQASDDYVYVVGNHIKCANWSNVWTYTSGIWWESQYHYAYIANNFIERQNTTYQRAIDYRSSKSGSAKDNMIINNTITGAQSGEWAMYIGSYNSINRVYNNLITGASIQYGITSAGYNLNNFFSYNHVQATNALGTTILDDGTNDLGGGNTIDGATGNVISGNAIDGGHPDAAYTDLDLTTNDAGCYGGSYSKSNFDVMVGLTGCKTTFLIAPRRVLVGQTIDIEGEGFDH